MDFNNSIRYRIGIINDFNGEFAFVDYRKFGENVFLDACWIKSEHKGYVVAKDSIGVFLNFNMVGDVKSKAEAARIIDRLIEESPTDTKKEFLLFKDYLTRVIK